MDKLDYGIVEYDGIEQVAVEMFLFTGLFVSYVTAIAQQAELIYSDAGDVFEHIGRNDFVERFQLGAFVAICHQE